MGLGDLTPIYRHFFIGSGIKHPPHPFDGCGDFTGRLSSVRPLETHMLDKMRDAGFGGSFIS